MIIPYILLYIRQHLTYIRQYLWRKKIFLLLIPYCFLFFHVAVYSTEHNTETKTFLTTPLLSHINVKVHNKHYIKVQEHTPQRLYQTYTFLKKDNEFLYLYSSSNKDWNIKIGQSIKDDKYIPSFGLQTIPFTIGSIQQYGEYKLFQDISQNFAWSSMIFQPFRWGIDHTSSEPTWGARLGIDPIQTWWIKRKETTLYGASVGYDFSFYEPRLLYQNSTRNSIDTNSSHWDAWLIHKPSSTELHQLVVSQTFSVANALYIQTVLATATSNTQATRMAGYTTIQYFTPLIDIKINYTQSDKDYISQEWSFAKYLWASSAELSVYYLPLFLYTPPATPKALSHSNAKIRLRAIVREYHPLNISYKKQDYLYQKYEFAWKHAFTKNTIEYLPYITYTWHLTEKYHKIKQELSIAVGDFTLSPSISTTFSYTSVYSEQDKETDIPPTLLFNTLDAIEILLRQKIKYNIPRVPLYFFSDISLLHQITFTYHSSEKYTNTFTIQEIHTTVGLTAQLRYLRLHTAYKTRWLPHSSKQKLHITLDIGMRYTIK